MNKIFRGKFDLFSEWVADHLGKPMAFALALAMVLIWAAFGPFTNYSQTWQLIINTGTTIATFLMVFLLQNTQNRDSEQEHKDLEEMLSQQKVILEQQRRMAEKLTEIQLTLDK